MLRFLRRVRKQACDQLARCEIRFAKMKVFAMSKKSGMKTDAPLWQRRWGRR
jgi:hypothetical protein